MPTTITSAGITFNDATSLTSANGVPSALKLTTARTINGVSFDGTANITVPASGVSAAKAWVNFNGTTSPGTIRSSYNVSSVTKTGTGNYILNFSTAFSNTSYAVVMGSSFNSSTGTGWLAFQDDRLGTKTVSQYYLATTDTTVYRDSPEISVAVFFN
jgi:hypothetical protein